MSSNFINDLVCQVCQNEISNDAIVSEVGRTLGVLSNYGIQKINLRFLGEKSPKNQVCQLIQNMLTILRLIKFMMIVRQEM